MKKKLMLTVLMLALLVCLLAISISAIEYDGVYYTIDTKNKVATVNQENRTSTTEIVTIPSTFEYEGETYKVTAIDNNAFWGNKSVKELRILSEFITKIPNSMISSTTGGALEKIYIDFSNITSIGSAAFNPSSQSNGNSPVANSFYYYDAKAFVENGTDVKITDPDFSNVTSIGTAAFQGANFEKLTIPAAVYLNNQMFRKSTIQELVIEGEDRTTIEYYVFQECKQLKKIVIKSRNLKTISNDVFSGSTAVEEIYIDLSKCESVRGAAFQFSRAYDAGNTTTQWFNLEGEKIVDLSSMKYFYDKSFCSSNLGSAQIVWPKAIEIFQDQSFRKCNINNQPIIINAAEGVTLGVHFWALNGNNPSIFLCNEGVTSFKARVTDCTVVLLAPSVLVDDKEAFKGNTTVYYKSLAEGSITIKCTAVQITDGTIYNYGVCGAIAEITTVDNGNVTVGTVSHTTESVIDNTLCPIGKVMVTACNYCDYVKYTIDGEAAERKEHNFDLSNGATIGGMAYESYFEMGFETIVCG